MRRFEGKGKGKGKGKKKKKKKKPGRIAISREQVFDAIDEGHSGNGHVGMERTATYC